MAALPLQCSMWVWGVLEYDFNRIKGSLDIEPNLFGCWGQCFVMSIIYTWHFNKWCPSVQSSSTQLMYFTAFALSHRNIHSCSGCPMGSAPPQSQDGEGKSSAPGAHPCLPRDWISQAENPKEATFIISAFENHLQSVCSIQLQPNTSQCNSVLWEVGQSWEKRGDLGAGSMRDTSWFPQKASNRKPYKRILAKSGFFPDELTLCITYTAARCQSHASRYLQSPFN